jgi:signal transduction histidine kinase
LDAGFQDAIMNLPMEQKRTVSIRTGGGADLAFALVVLAAFFATFNSIKNASVVEIFLMISLGIAYSTVGIYGYAFANRSTIFLYKLAYFAIQIILAGLVVNLGNAQNFNMMIFLPLAGHSIVMLSQLWAYGVNFSLIIAYFLFIIPLPGGWGLAWTGFPIFFAALIFIVAFTQMAVSEEKSRSEVERLVKQLEDANQRLRKYAIQVDELATTRERNRLAREIHDGLGHYLTTINMQIQAALAVMGKDNRKAKDALSTAQNMTHDALDDVRQSVAALRASPDEDLPLNERIINLTSNLPSSGITPTFEVIGEPRALSPQITLTIFRTAQEGINNACKHAKATKVHITLDFSDPISVTLSMQDNGIGSDVTTGGFGLIGLRERAHFLNGNLTTRTTPGQGFELEIKLPT